jgi:hypothetical protein
VKTLLQKLSSLIDDQIDQIIQVSTGTGIDFKVDEHLSYLELLLVEGDPEVVEQLQRESLGSKRKILNVLVTPDGGNVSFYRYNFSLLNSTLAPGKIEAIYPSARLISEITLPSTPFSSLLRTVVSNQVGKRLLILDVPGQETALLKSLGLSQLHLFQWILIRGCREALQEGAVEIAQSMSLLQNTDYQCISYNDQVDPEWPVALHYCDRECSHYPAPDPIVPDRESEGGYPGELNEKSAELEALQEELAGRARILIRKELENYQLREQVDRLEKQAAVTQQEIEVLREINGRSQLQNLVPTERLASLEQELSSKTTLLEVLQQGRQFQDRLYAELKLERDEMSRRLVELYTLTSELEDTIAAKEHLGKTIDAEFQKAEGQIEMIKEIFLREKNR